MNMQQVLDKVIEDVRPNQREQQHVQDMINDVLTKIKVKNAQPVLGGSGAKNTWLKNTTDIDIYVTFPYNQFKDTSKKLSDLLEKDLKKSFKKLIRLHGSRDYFQIQAGKFTVELVPILKITSAQQAKNITDVSLLHVAHVKKFPHLADDIRLAKTFAQAQGVYGAESYIKGFSGYVLELLVIHYGSFLQMVTAVAKWKDETIFGDLQKAMVLNPAKKSSPLILIDPVQDERNAAAAISQEKYNLFRKACNQFVKKPSKQFFSAQAVDTKKLKKKGHLTHIVALPVSPKRDIGGAKALKAFQYLLKQLEEYKIKEKVFVFDGKHVEWYVVTKQKVLSTKMKQYGPPVRLKNKKAVEKFKKSHPKNRINIDKKTKRYVVWVQRQDPKLSDRIRTVLKQEQVQKRVKRPIMKR